MVSPKSQYFLKTFLAITAAFFIRDSVQPNVKIISKYFSGVFPSKRFTLNQYVSNNLRHKFSELQICPDFDDEEHIKKDRKKYDNAR